MKVSNKIGVIAVAIIFTTLTAFTADKYYNLKFSEEALNKHFQNLNTIKAIVDKSNLPHQEVLFITSSIDSLQKEMTSQVRGQIEPPVKK